MDLASPLLRLFTLRPMDILKPEWHLIKISPSPALTTLHPSIRRLTARIKSTIPSRRCSVESARACLMRVERGQVALVGSSEWMVGLVERLDGRIWRRIWGSGSAAEERGVEASLETFES
jgi:hypothetical protein